MADQEPLTREEACWVERPDGEPWSWSPPVNAVLTASGRWADLGEWTATVATVEEMFQRLYDCGWAVVRVGPMEGADRRTIARHESQDAPPTLPPVLQEETDP